jgi:hypothetical protein
MAGVREGLVAACSRGEGGLVGFGRVPRALVWRSDKQDRRTGCFLNAFHAAYRIVQEGGMIWLQQKIENARQKLKGWKTVIFGSVIAALGSVLDILDALRAIDITPLLPPAYAIKIIAGIGVVTILLRLMTTGAVGEKER